MKQEKRAFEVRAVTDAERPKLVGYAAKFDTLSDDLGGFREKIAPGAFAATLKTADVRALFDHDSKYVLGRNTSGTLELKEDETGLLMEVVPPDTQWARDLLASVQRGDISQMSFGFTTISDKWEKDEGTPIRTLEAVNLFDVSVVTYPAYPDTEVAKRSLTTFLEQAAPAETGGADPSETACRERKLNLLNLKGK